MMRITSFTDWDCCQSAYHFPPPVGSPVISAAVEALHGQARDVHGCVGQEVKRAYGWRQGSYTEGPIVGEGQAACSSGSRDAHDLCPGVQGFMLHGQ